MKQLLKFVASVFVSNSPAGIEVSASQLAKQLQKDVASVLLLNSVAGIEVSPVQ
jgi:hypothetical protein